MFISLPTESRQRAFAFYQEAFGLKPIDGPIEADGVPEPLQFALTDSVTLMLIPADGFAYVLGSQPAAPRGSSECILSLRAGSEAEVQAIVDRAVTAGATIVSAPSRRPWAYIATLTDPDGHLWMIETA